MNGTGRITLRDGGILRYRTTGPVGAPGVLMLHGIGTSLEDFDEQHRLLTQLRCTSLDLPGFGGSEPLHGPVTLRGLAGAVVQFLDAVAAPGPVHVVGNSLGGAVAMQFALLAPDRVSSLLLAAPAGFGRTVTWALRLITVPGVGEVLLRPSESSARRTQGSLFADPRLVTADRVERALRLARRPRAAATTAATARAVGTVAGVRRGWRDAVLEGVADLGTPVLVVWGEDDRILPAAHLRRVHTELPAARTHLYPRTGHMPQIERAEEFAGLARAFWSTA